MRLTRPTPQSVGGSIWAHLQTFSSQFASQLIEMPPAALGDA